MSNKIEVLASLFVQTGHAHHQAFIESDGVDLEWALWYANYMQAKLSKLLTVELTQSVIVYWLIKLEIDYRAAAPEEPWPQWYGSALIDHYSN